MPEPEIFLQEREVGSLLQELRLLESFGFSLPLPEMPRTPGQPADTFVLLSQIRVGSSLAIGCSATLKKVGWPNNQLACGVLVSENTGKVLGRSEIVLRSGLGSPLFVLTAKIGKDASLDMVRLCGGLGIDRLIETKRLGILPEQAETAFRAVASWANGLGYRP